MRQKHLVSCLSSLQREFPDPDVKLEQYPTSPQLAASVVLLALQNGDLGPGQACLDLGCGTGMLSIAAALVETDSVLGVDCDASALAVAMSNAETADVEDQVDFLQAKVRDLTTVGASVSSTETDSGRGGGGTSRGRGGRGKGRSRGRGRGRRPTQSRSSTSEARQLIMSDDDGLPLASKCVDTVLTNPPFGTKSNAGMDLRFLRTATRLSRRAVYSFHKTSTRDFMTRQVESWGFEAKIVAEMRFDLPQSYKFHQKKSVDVAVDLIRVIVCSSDEDQIVAGSEDAMLRQEVVDEYGSGETIEDDRDNESY